MRSEKEDTRGKMKVTRIKRVFFALAFLASCILPLASGHAANILITGDACANAVAATPSPDLAYTPGVDVNGKAVAPADPGSGAGAGLPGGGAVTPPSDITIPLQLNLKNALHLPNNSNLTSPQAIVGTIEVKNGVTTYNGQPISQDAQAEIEAACRQTRTAHPPILGKPSKNLLLGE